MDEKVRDVLELRRTAKEIKRYRMLMRSIALLVVLLIIIVAVAYAISYFYDRFGAFTIRVDKYDMVRQGLPHLAHTETDIDGIALQPSWREAHHRILISDARIIKVDGLRAVEKRQIVMPFSIGAGAVRRVNDADVHILHAEVAVNGGLGLCEKRRSKE